MSSAVRISAIYLLLGVTWILLSDSLLQVLTGSQAAALTLMQTLKGWFFILTTAGLLYVLLRRELNARQYANEARLREEAKFHTLFTANPVPMWVFNRNSLQFLDANDAACIHYGYTRTEFLRMRITDLRPHEEVPRLMEYLSQASAGFRFAGEWRHITKDGRVIDVSVSAHTIDFAGQEAILATIQDITERKRMEAERLENEKLRLMLTKESQLRSMRNRFISMVSHEFRRPLTTITTSIELLENYGNRMSDEAAQKHFERIHEQLDETKELLDDFLDLIRAEEAEQGFKPIPTELTEICHKLVDALKLSASAEHRIIFDTSCESVRIPGDEKLLRHAIGNLLTNALKYSPQGGEVRLDLLRHADKIHIQVSDQGIGIPQKEQERIFSPFYRASNVEEIGGTGLGLSIAKQAVELHGGTLDISKSDSRGTTFVIHLPVDAQTFLTGC